MSNLPILFVVFLLLCGVFMIIRNIYYFKLWCNRNKFDNKDQYSKVFSSGVQKFILPIITAEKVTDPVLKKNIRTVNLFNFLAILSFIISGIAFFNN